MVWSEIPESNRNVLQNVIIKSFQALPAAEHDTLLRALVGMNVTMDMLSSEAQDNVRQTIYTADRTIVGCVFET